MTKLSVSSLIKIMKEKSIESGAILEGLRKSLFIKNNDELINPDNVEFRIAEKNMVGSTNQPPSYVISVSWDKSKYLSCMLDEEKKEIIFCNVVGDTDVLVTHERLEFLKLNKEIILKALQEANTNKKYVSLNSCNMWQSTLSRYYSKPHSFIGVSPESNSSYIFDISGTQISLKDKTYHLWFNVYNNTFSYSKSSIYVIKEKVLSSEEEQLLFERMFDNILIDIEQLPTFWQSIINNANHLSLKKA